MRSIVLPLLALSVSLTAADHSGVVACGGVPVPGATVTVTDAAGNSRRTISSTEGRYSFLNLHDGTWTVTVEMQLFGTQRRQVTLTADANAAWELAVLPSSQATSGRSSAEVREAPVAAEPSSTDRSVPAAAPAHAAADGFLINGSMNNAAASDFGLLRAFGNHRKGPRSLYNGNLGMIANNALFDARPYSLTGQSTPKPGYSRLQALLSFGGPLRIPVLLQRNAPNLTLNYQWTRNQTASTETALMPSFAKRQGQHSVINGGTSPQARALLELFPLPNFEGSSRYNYQVPLVSGFHQDDLQLRLNKQMPRHFATVLFAAQSTRTDATDVFGFLDTGRRGGINAGLNYRYAFGARTFLNMGVQFSRLTDELVPYFARRRNVSAEAGFSGNNQEPGNWGPPNLVFSGGITPLVLPQASTSRNQTMGVAADAYLNRGRHNLTFGGVLRKQQFNLLSQEDARGSLTFNGVAAGTDDFTAFLLGIPDISSIAYGNADKYLRAGTYEAFLNDDWRVHPGLTINAGVRWEHWSPITEKFGRLVNLAVTAGFDGVNPLVARESDPSGFPRPDRNNFAPRIAFSWRPLAASSAVVRGGYGIYYDTSVYSSLATRMAQQAPLSRSFRAVGTRERPLSLASAFEGAGVAQHATFAVDPHFRVGYSQNWQLSIQRDLPGALQTTITYNGSKGTRGQQQFLPNTFPDGAVASSGYLYVASNGNASRHAGQLQLRRRLRSGFMATIQYTWAKSIDDATFGGGENRRNFIAQNWLDFGAERARSNFDQRHLLAATVQYTTGMGARGGTLLSGWRGALLKEWTVGSELTAGSGLPLTPVYLRAHGGTGFTGALRPDFTGADLYAAPPGLFLNPEAISLPRSESWGNAGRNSINGPSQFALSASLGRTFRGTERFSLDVRLNAVNALNTVVYRAWNTVASSAQFGVPTSVAPMRTIQMLLRTRF